MNELKACGIVLCALIVCIVFKNLKSDYSLFVRLIITISIFSVSIITVSPVIGYIEEVSRSTAVYSYIPTLFKALAIAFTVQITADICTDAQETSLAERICFFGKTEILLVSLPLIKQLLSLCQDLLV